MKNTKKLIHGLQVLVAKGETTDTSFSYRARSIQSDDANAFSRIFTKETIKLINEVETNEEEVVVIPLLNPMYEYNPYDIKNLIEDVLMVYSPFEFDDIYKTYEIDGIEAYTGFNSRLQYLYNILLAVISYFDGKWLYKDEYEYSLYASQLTIFFIAYAYAIVLEYDKTPYEAAKLIQTIYESIRYDEEEDSYYLCSFCRQEREDLRSIDFDYDKLWDLMGYMNNETSTFKH